MRINFIKGCTLVLVLLGLSFLLPEPNHASLGKNTYQQTIAILPFLNANSSGDNDYLSETFSSSITSKLRVLNRKVRAVMVKNQDLKSIDLSHRELTDIGRRHRAEIVVLGSFSVDRFTRGDGSGQGHLFLETKIFNVKKEEILKKNNTLEVGQNDSFETVDRIAENLSHVALISLELEDHNPIYFEDNYVVKYHLTWDEEFFNNTNGKVRFIKDVSPEQSKSEPYYFKVYYNKSGDIIKSVEYRDQKSNCLDYYKSNVIVRKEIYNIDTGMLLQTYIYHITGETTVTKIDFYEEGLLVKFFLGWDELGFYSEVSPSHYYDYDLYYKVFYNNDGTINKSEKYQDWMKVSSGSYVDGELKKIITYDTNGTITKEEDYIPAKEVDTNLTASEVIVDSSETIKQPEEIQCFDSKKDKTALIPEADFNKECVCCSYSYSNYQGSCLDTSASNNFDEWGQWAGKWNSCDYLDGFWILMGQQWYVFKDRSEKK